MVIKNLRSIVFLFLLLPALPLMSTVWTPSVQISPPSTPSQFAFSPQVSMNAKGNAVAVWVRINGITQIIESATYNGSIWSSSVQISPPSIAGEDASGPQVSMNENGNAVAVWVRFNGTTFAIESAAYNGSSWSSSVTISPSISGQPAASSQVSINASGNAVAVWTRYNGTAFVTESATYNGSSWSSYVTISPSIAGQDAFDPHISMNASGNAVAAWGRYNGTVQVIESATYNGSSWSSSVTISPSIAGQNAASPQVSMNPSGGNAIAVWQLNNGTVDVIESATYNGSSWSSSAQISPPSIAGQDARNPQVSMNESGNAVAVWQRFNGTVRVIESRTYNGSSWSSSVQISPPSTSGQDASSPQVSMNVSGSSVAVWQRNNGTVDVIESATYNGSSWSSSVNISPSIAGQDAFQPEVSMNTSGNTIAVWGRYNGTVEVIESASGFAESGSRRGGCSRCRRCSSHFR